MLLLRKFWSLVARRPGYAFTLSAIFIIGVLLSAATRMALALPPELGGFLGALGDALVIAALVAAVVDPFAQHQFAAEWGRDLFWAIFSPNAPEEFRDALQVLAAPNGYIRRCTWELTFELSATTDDVVDLDIAMIIQGTNLDRRGYRPNDVVYCIARWDGTPSTYTYWSFEGDGVEPTHYSEEEMKQIGALHEVPSVETGRIMLDQRLLVRPGLKIPFNRQYTTQRTMRTSRRTCDHFPLFLSRITLEQVVNIRGGAAPHLDFGVVQLGGAEYSGRPNRRPDGRVELQYRVGDVSFPNQGTLVEWRPKSDHGGMPAAGTTGEEC